MKYLKTFESLYGDVEDISGKNFSKHIPIMISEKVVKLLSNYKPQVEIVSTDMHGHNYPNPYSYIRMSVDNVDFLENFKNYVQVICKVNINEYEDEWFRVTAFIQYKKDYRHKIEHEVKNYMCDQFDGLVQFLKDQNFDITL
jgi:hypothetical protein